MNKIDLDTLEKEFSNARTNLVTDRLDMSFGEIMNMYQDKEIIISPEFQRLFRWSDYQKTRFIESVLLGIPIPPIFVAEDEDGKWELVDGLQRISTIFSFFGILKKDENELDEKSNDWPFTEGDIIASLEGKNKNDLPLKLLLTIKRAVCRVELLRWNKENQNLKYELFNRLNTGGSQATEQEIRNCIFRGINDKFNKFLKELSKSNILKFLISPSEEQVNELYLEEQLLRFVSLYFATEKVDISDNISKYMTNFMKENVNNSEFKYEEAENIFNRVLLLLNKLDDEKIFRSSKGPFSSNIYDVIMLGIAHNIESYESQDLAILKNKINDLKESDLLKSTSSGKVSSKYRNSKRIELAKSFFQI